MAIKNAKRTYFEKRATEKRKLWQASNAVLNRKSQRSHMSTNSEVFLDDLNKHFAGMGGPEVAPLVAGAYRCVQVRVMTPLLHRLVLLLPLVSSD